jgi:hypothetical protein
LWAVPTMGGAAEQEMVVVTNSHRLCCSGL